MKKSILISLLLPFFLFSCSKNEEVKLENPINSNTGVEVKADSGTIETNIQSGSVEINTGITEEIANSGSLENESGTTKNLVPFSDSQIQDILAKIDENTKKQQEKNTNTGILINGNYKAEYDKINTKIKIIIDGKRNEFNGINGEFLSFIDFSPSGNYLYYM